MVSIDKIWLLFQVLVSNMISIIRRPRNNLESTLLDCPKKLPLFVGHALVTNSFKLLTEGLMQKHPQRNILWGCMPPDPVSLCLSKAMVTPIPYMNAEPSPSTFWKLSPPLQCIILWI